MNGLEWEMKSPKGAGKYTIRDMMRVAAQQSQNTVIDLRRTKLNQIKALKQVQKYFLEMQQIKRMLIISQNQIFDFEK